VLSIKRMECNYLVSEGVFIVEGGYERVRRGYVCLAKYDGF
jgi:hypothetical protein